MNSYFFAKLNSLCENAQNDLKNLRVYIIIQFVPRKLNNGHENIEAT